MIYLPMPRLTRIMTRTTTSNCEIFIVAILSDSLLAPLEAVGRLIRKLERYGGKT